MDTKAFTANQEEPKEVLTPEILSPEPIKINPKHISVMAMREQGIKNGEIAAAMGYHSTYPSIIAKKLQKYKLGENAKLVKDAFQCVKKLVNGEVFGSIEKVKDSTALQASSMVMDRFDPVTKHNLNLNANVNIGPVDYGKLMERYG